MSNETPDKDLDLDSAFLPSWAQESPEINRYANYEGERGNRRFNSDRRGPGRSGGGGDRPRGNRSEGGRSGGGNRPGGGDRGPQGRGPGQGQRSDQRRGRPPYERREEVPMPEVNLRIVPDDRGVDSLAKQIRMTGRAYPLFDIARLVLQKDDRYQIEFTTKKNPDGTVAQPMFTCALDDTVWLSEEDAVAHTLDRHLATFYEITKTPTDPPKGTYTFVAQCGMSGIILGPPNYHDYQNKLHQLHKERFSRMAFENFKSRVKIVRDEEVVKKWIDEQSFKTEYVVLNVPEPLTLASFDAVQKHFRETHLPEMIKSVDIHVVTGDKSRRVGSRELQRFVFRSVDDQKRFPLKLVTALSHKFSTRGLHFFKVKKSIVHVAVARPHFLDIDATPVSDGVRKIVEYVNEHSRCSVKELVDFLAPTAEEAKAEPETVKPAESVTPADTASAAEGAALEKPPVRHEPTAAQKAVLADLHWLVHEGHVIEFASGELETAKKPHPKPQPKKKAAPKPKEKRKELEVAAVTTAPVQGSEPKDETIPAIAAGPAPVVAPVEMPPAVENRSETETPIVTKPVIDGSAVGDIEISEPENVSPVVAPVSEDEAEAKEAKKLVSITPPSEAPASDPLNTEPENSQS